MPRKEHTPSKFPWLLISQNNGEEFYRPANEVLTTAEIKAKKFADSIHFLTPDRVSLRLRREEKQVTHVQLSVSMDWSQINEIKQFKVNFDLENNSCEIHQFVDSSFKGRSKHRRVVTKGVNKTIRRGKFYSELIKRLKFILETIRHKNINCRKRLVQLLNNPIPPKLQPQGS